MRCFLMGKLRDVGISDPDGRSVRAHAKAVELGIVVLERCLTVGRYDFCTLIEAPDLATASAFDHWYSREGLGDLEILVVHDARAVSEISRVLSSGGQ